MKWSYVAFQIFTFTMIYFAISYVRKMILWSYKRLLRGWDQTNKQTNKNKNHYSYSACLFTKAWPAEILNEKCHWPFGSCMRFQVKIRSESISQFGSHQLINYLQNVYIMICFSHNLFIHLAISTSEILRDWWQDCIFLQHFHWFMNWVIQSFPL